MTSPRRTASFSIRFALLFGAVGLGAAGVLVSACGVSGAVRGEEDRSTSGADASTDGAASPSPTSSAPSSDADAAPPSPSRADAGVSDLPCDVDAVVEKNCRTCHASPPRYGAPMPLVTHADFAAAGKGGAPIWQRVGARIHDDASPMPAPPNPRLSAADAAVLDAWIAAGAPPATAATACRAPAGDGGAAPTPANAPLDCNADLHLAPQTPYALPNDVQEQYVCYGVDVDLSAKRHVVGIGPRVDNAAVVHHVLLFQSDTAVSPTPSPCLYAASAAWRLVAGWAPGAKNFYLPPEAGFPEEKGTTHWVLQVHYNNPTRLPNVVDGSGFDLCTTDQLRANDADIVAFGSSDFTIPPRASLSHTCTWQIPFFFDKLHFFAANPHMHRLGTSVRSDLLPGGGGASVPIVDEPAWNFDDQYSRLISLDANAGDTIQTNCTWKNPGDTAVSFGENSEDEMCFSFVQYYPKIDLPLWSWGSPTLPFVADCKDQVGSL